MDLASGQIDAQGIAFLNIGIQFGAFENRQAIVDGIAIERACERTRHYGLDPEPLDRRRRLLARAAAAKVAARNQDLKLAQLGRESFAQNFERVLSQTFAIDVDEITTRNDDVGVDVVAELVDAALDGRFHLEKLP